MKTRIFACGFLVLGLRAATHHTPNTSPICFKAVLDSDLSKAISVWNENITANGCQGEEVFRVWGDGRVEAKRVKIFTSGWCDYVFDADYKLPSLDSVDAFIQEHGHLPEVPTEAEVKADGVDVGTMETILLKKVEELTLYTIAQQKRMVELEKLVMDLNAKLNGR